MSHFSDNYYELRYPISTDSTIGLRNAQLGAIHAIASFNSLSKKNAGIVVMPTGSGKTAVLMMTPYITLSSKVLIVTPSVMVRGQIYKDFTELKTLKKASVFIGGISPPSVYELKKKYSNDIQDDVITSDVIIATPQCALSLSENNIKDKFDLVLIDEAHHVPAQTWQQILLNMKDSTQMLFTATPFRMDRKELKGEIVYTYPLSMAYRDGIFGEVRYIPIEEAPDKDMLIAKEAERVFFNDRQQGYNHFLMVRTDTREKAKQLEQLYQNETELTLKRIDSSMSYRVVEQCISELKNKNIDGIICVDMLGEGFDFPNLKIAAIHTPHKSLASTLQFIGRFARTNAENISAAKFIAMNDDELIIENYKLYTSDAVWQEMIVDMSERTIRKEEEIKNNLGEYIRNDGSLSSDDTLSLHSIRPNCHAKIYHISDFNINGVFPKICGVGENVFRNLSDNTVIGIGTIKNRPIWSNTEQVLDVQNFLFIIHFQKETSLLFIYSQMKSEIDYQLIAEAFTTNYNKVPRNEIHRVLGELQEFEMFNTGMQNRFAESGESYRIYAGSNVASTIDPATGRMYSAGHVFCKAVADAGPVTIGYSSGSKIWSSSYLLIPEYVKWCDSYGLKIANESIKVKTNTNYDLMPLPHRLKNFPETVFFCLFSDRTYSSSPVVMKNPSEVSDTILMDAEIKIISISEMEIQVEVSILGFSDTIVCRVDGTCYCAESTIFLKDGRNRVSLVEYLNNYPFIFKTTDDAIIEGHEISIGEPNAIIFSSENIKSIDWGRYKIDIRIEFGEASEGLRAIQDGLEEILIQQDDFDYLIYDHGSGEIADYITIRETDHKLEVVLYHVKAMGGKRYNSDLGDIYEVTQQAIKSIIWLKSRGTLLEKIRDRRRSDHCKMKKGHFQKLEKSLKENKLFTSRIVIVQPSINRTVDLPSKYQEILAATNFYIKNSGRVTEFGIWGSGGELDSSITNPYQQVDMQHA
ncbi:DEAD/DEAH box helicase [Paenibacillus zeisoli]|uniref:DEAD/DEAH box helicase n=1 Tax=Paenibacillus zeisoli TaxID=2496267 RepID=A0A3S1B922_9BACL|nr:DEAD/DEAH box helicase family protein [Paenibacillus zeisoli]RUT33710.1 DEAD/DEAH box helicase [Paenibacillus zeisoli]